MPSVGLLFLAFAAAVSTSSVSSAATQPAPLVSGADRLEITTVGRGKSTVPAQTASLSITIRGKGPTLAEAERLAETRTAGVLEALRRAGVPNSSITEEASAIIGFVGNEELGDEIPAAMQEAMAKQPRTARRSVTVEMRDLALLPKVQAALKEVGAATVEEPSYGLLDDRQARQIAIADAIRKARIDAEAYAAATGMRVQGMVRVRDLSATPSIFAEYQEMAKRFLNRGVGKKRLVETDIGIAADFVLVPR